MLKDIYEALRNGKGWSKTLFIVTYDDYGKCSSPGARDDTGSAFST